MDYKRIAALAGAVGYGVVVGWAITADRYDNTVKMQNIMIDYLRDRPINIFNTTSTLSHPEEESNSPGGETDETNVTGEVEEETEPEDPEVTRANLQAVIDQYTGDPDTVEAFISQTDQVRENPKAPYIVSRERYAYDEDYDDFDKETVRYLPKFRVLLDDDDEVVDEPGNVIGWRILSSGWGDQSGDMDTVFVRNERMRCDYEVVRDEDAQLPLHVKYGMPFEEFAAARTAGTLRLRDEDRD